MNQRNVSCVLAVCLVVFVSWASAENSTVTPSPSPSPEDVCRGYNENCETCVKHASCLWCKSDKDKCIPYPKGQIIPHKDICPLDQARWGVCWMNYKALLISMGVIGGILIISLCVCCYCCCCRANKKKQQRKYQKEDARYEREREERRARSEERKSERRSKYDEIRRKYGIGRGLIKDDAPYQKFENETA